jgi:hypothetical protein
MINNIRNYRFWLLYLIIALVVFLMITSFLGPWWTSTLVNAPGGPAVNILVEIFQWGIPEGYYSEHFQPDVTPVYQVWLSRGFLALSILLLLIAPWLRSKASRIIFGVMGTSWLFYACGALYMIYNRTKEYGIPLQGSETVYDYVYVMNATSGFEPAYFMAIAASIICLLLCFIHKLIVKDNSL